MIDIYFSSISIGIRPMENFKRVTLSTSSTEFKDILNQFDTTMKYSYQRIIRIERIQNKRWYIQVRIYFLRQGHLLIYVNSHFISFSMQRIEKNFNNDIIGNRMKKIFFTVVPLHQPRKSSKNVLIGHLPVSMVISLFLFFSLMDHSLGVFYGCGVYFHTSAKYSHSYAKISSTGERTMFLARVLVGKTTDWDFKI